MAIDSQVLAEINACQYLVVQNISEPGDNTLRVVVDEARAEAETVSVEVGGTLLTGGHRVRSTPECHLYEILWEHYVAYSVTNELFGKSQDAESSSGHRLRIFSKSYFLDYVAQATIATSEYPGPLQHIELLSENHIIDVVSAVEPRIARIR